MGSSFDLGTVGVGMQRAGDYSTSRYRTRRVRSTDRLERASATHAAHALTLLRSRTGWAPSSSARSCSSSAACGTAVLAAGVPDVGVGILGVALAFGLSVMTMAYAVGHVSGAHFNPAVTIGLAVGRRFAWRDVLPYIVTQVVGGTARRRSCLLVVANGQDGFIAPRTAASPERVRRPLPGRLRPARRARRRGRHHRAVPLRDPRRHGRPGAGRASRRSRSASRSPS